MGGLEPSGSVKEESMDQRPLKEAVAQKRGEQATAKSGGEGEGKTPISFATYG